MRESTQMPPINNIEIWGRKTDEGEPILPRKRLYLLYEGSVTEEDYFKELVALLNRNGLPRYMAVNRCVRTEKERNESHPARLLEFAREIQATDSFREGDEVAVVFDADVYRNKADEYTGLLKSLQDEAIEPYVTFPCFELFLFLHVEHGLDDWVLPNKEKVLENARRNDEGKHTKRTYLERLFSRVTGVNPKRAGACGRFARDYRRAVQEELRINRDASGAIGVLTSSVGLLIERLTAE